MSITGRVSSGHTHSYSHLSPLHQALTTTTLTTTPLPIHHTKQTPPHQADTATHHHTKKTLSHPLPHHHHTRQTPQDIHHRCLVIEFGVVIAGVNGFRIQISGQRSNFKNLRDQPRNKTDRATQTKR
ncbi:hypothetical protein Pmani_032482 [Petrolisthes manimaculis]|uniref:Uncharacterized protein n=1 Tax=Petrolisthes manimaculis TaxID=1843537 RepID=A0AAE1NRR2_9EUCA|nr:hypothetical protein Pmani_032482 [Petrolisthes manimaculis]